METRDNISKRRHADGPAAIGNLNPQSPRPDIVAPFAAGHLCNKTVSKDIPCLCLLLSGRLLFESFIYGMIYINTNICKIKLQIFVFFVKKHYFCEKLMLI